MTEALAPCVVVVGPPNSGKTSFLHLLDEALHRHPDGPLVYVVKGNPDGTGRYLLHAPELREPLKSRVKGSWSSETVETVSGWIDNCRRHLDLVLLDFGGRHGPGNDAMLGRCSHFIVVARSFGDPVEEQSNGLGSWVEVCRRNGLSPVAVVRSLLDPERAGVGSVGAWGLEAIFRGDDTRGEDPANREVAAAIAEVLVALRPRTALARYVDLRLGRRWTVEDLRDLGGCETLISDLVERQQPVVLGGGYAPVWAYAAAMHRALDLDPAARIVVFDPKVAGGLVEVPARLGAPDAALAQALRVVWAARPAAGGGATLDLKVATADRFLRPGHVSVLPGAPTPAAEPAAGPRVVCGAVPIWLHLTYSRWLRSLPGVEPIGAWDAGLRAAVLVTGRGAPTTLSWELPEEMKPDFRDDGSGSASRLAEDPRHG